MVWKHHVFTFLMVLGNTRIYLNNSLEVSNNPTEDDPGTGRSKQTASKRKRVKSNDCKKKPRE